MAGFSSNVADRFAPGSRVDVLDAISGQVVKSVSVKDDGSVSVSGLEAGWGYVLAQEGNRVAFLAKESKFRQESPAEAQAKAAGGLPSAAPGYTTQPNVITGARGSKDVKARHQAVLTEDRAKVQESEPRPHVNQLDVPKSAVQRSDTAFGEATPKAKGEDVPTPSQDDVKGLQRSDTELGEGTPKPRDEVEPAVSQEDAPRGVVQSSDTEFGEITPKSSAKSKAKRSEAEAASSSSEQKVSGDVAKASKRAARRK